MFDFIVSGAVAFVAEVANNSVSYAGKLVKFLSSVSGWIRYGKSKYV